MKNFSWVILLITPFYTFAQDSSSVDLSQVTVTANIIETSTQKAARNVSIIDSKTIAQSPVKSIDGIMQYALNVDVRTRSPFGVQADISIRGGHFDQTLIMIDGIKMNDPQTGHHSLNLPIPIEMIDRIEVLQGGASRVFGPSAFSGVINIITKKEFAQMNRWSVGIGQHALRRVNLQSGVSKGKTTAFINLEQIDSDGYAYNTAFNKKTAYAKVSHVLKNGLVTVQGGVMDNKFGAANFYFPSFYDQYEEVKSKVIAVTLENSITNNFSTVFNLSFRRHNDLYDFNNFRKTNISSVNFHESDVLDYEWKGRWLNNLGATSFGLEWREESVLSNRLGELRLDKVAVPAYDSVFYDKGISRKNTSGYFEHQKQWGDFLISGGALLNFNSQFGTELYPGIDVSFQAAPGQSFYASANRSLRFPTFTELYLNTSTVVSDPNLKPEKAVSYELGYKLLKRNLAITTSVFYKQTQDAIDKVKRPDLPRPTNENIDNINFGGFEFSGKIMVPQISILESIQFNYAYLVADRKEDGFQSFYTLNFLKHKWSTGANLVLAKGLTGSIWYTFKKREGTYQFRSSDPVIAYKPVNLVDVRLKYEFKNIDFTLDANNLLNYEYYEFGFVEQPGRWISGGFSFRF